MGGQMDRMVNDGFGVDNGDYRHHYKGVDF